MKQDSKIAYMLLIISTIYLTLLIGLIGYGIFGWFGLFLGIILSLWLIRTNSKFTSKLIKKCSPFKWAGSWIGTVLGGAFFILYSYMCTCTLGPFDTTPIPAFGIPWYVFTLCITLAFMFMGFYGGWIIHVLYEKTKKVKL